jgi:uncharacterized coiled-coil protein SlyX
MNHLIELAEELYALGQNPFEDSLQNGDAMQDIAMELGQAIQETGNMIMRYQKDIKDLTDKIQWMANRIIELELKYETRH